MRPARPAVGRRRIRGKDGDLDIRAFLAKRLTRANPVFGSVVAVNPSTPADFIASATGCTSVLPKGKLALR